MILFLPAWYQGDEFCENEQNWYTQRTETEFDDSVKQIQLFARNRSYEYKILLLSYAPNFRHFLHRQGVYHAPYWSIFDAICEVDRNTVKMFSYHNLNWPEGIEFIHTPYVIIAQLGDKKYAEIDLGEDGNTIKIDMFKNNEIVRKNIYDDRGFVGSTILYQNGEVHHQDYLMTDGTWKIRRFFSDGHICVNPQRADYMLEIGGERITKSFTKTNYQSMEELIQEILESYISFLPESDIFVCAFGCHHDRMLSDTLRNRKTIASLFGGRSKKIDSKAAGMLMDVDYIISDAVETTGKLVSETGTAFSNLIEITPYDTRVDLGISQQLSVQNIFVPVDSLGVEESNQLVVELGCYLEKNKDAIVHLFTRDMHYDRAYQLRKMVEKVLREAGMDPYHRHEIDYDSFESDTEQRMLIERFVVDQCVTELEVSKILKEQRVIVDIRKQSALYLQVSAVSMGIPMIVYETSEFIIEGKNAYLLRDISELQEGLQFYLENLANWNNAVVANFDIGKKHTTKILLDKWREVIEFVAKN